MPGADLFSTSNNNFSNQDNINNNRLGGPVDYVRNKKANPTANYSSEKLSTGQYDGGFKAEPTRQTFPPQLVNIYYRKFKSFLEQEESRGPINSGFSVDDDNSSVYSNSSIKARDQLGGLAESQLQELCMDIYDELERRSDYSTFISRQRHEIQYGQECPPTSLQPNSEFSERRNDARAKLAIMPNSKFRMLLGELVPELIKRYPTLKTPSITSSGNSSSSNTPHGRNNNGYEHSGYGNSSQNASPATSGFRQMDNAFSAMQMSNHAPDSRPSNPVLHVPPAPTSPKKSYTATGQHLNPMQAYEQRTDSANTSSSSLFTGNSKNPFSAGFDSKHSTSSSANHSMQFTPDKQAYDTMHQLIEQQKEQISSYKQQIDKLTKDNQHLLGMINELMEYFKTPSKN